jgi:ribosomal protein L37E
MNQVSTPFPPPDFIPTQSAVPGIEVYMPAPPDRAAQQEVVDFLCPRCGATTAFSAADGGLTCSHCGYFEAPKTTVVGKRAEKYEFTVETMERAAQGWESHNWDVDRKEMACQNCGALTSVPVENLTHTCHFCGSNKVIQREAPQDVLRPRFLIPFKFEAANCAAIARTWLGSSWMVPKSLQSAATLANFTAVYLPFWTFNATTSAAWKAEVGHQETERYFSNGEWKERIVTRWRWESGNVRLKIEDLLVEGTGRLSTLLLEKIKNFELSALTAYEPDFLAGLQAQAYDIPLEKAWDSGRQAMREQTRQACLKQASTSQVRNFSMNLDFNDESWRYILLPVYLNTYHFENKTFQMMVNGQTGAISGQRPVDWNKVWLAIAALLSPGLFLGLVGLVTAALGIGIGIGAIGFILLIIGTIIGIIVFVQAQGMDDA